MSPMRCVVTSFGSAGDFLPTLALGAVLHRRGHEVRFVANPFYESRARSTGLPRLRGDDGLGELPDKSGVRVNPN